MCVLFQGTAQAGADKGDREQAMALLIGADALMTGSDFIKGAEMCRRALAADPSCPAAHFKLGECLEKSSKPRDAFKSYQTAELLAKKENDAAMARKATTAAEKLGKGLIDISVADRKLIDKLLPLAGEAFDDDQYDTSRSAFAAVLALQPENTKAKEGLEKVEKAIELRGDPVKAKLAATMLTEVLYYMGTGKKDEASKIANDIVARHGDTGPGKDAAQLLANNFEPPKNMDVEVAEMKKVLKEKAKKIIASAPKAATPNPGAIATTASAPAVDVDAIEKEAMEETKKLGKGVLISTYKEVYTKGRDAFVKATPGTEGNQKNLQEALRSFIRCEQIFIRIDEEKLADADIQAMQKDASARRYSCMKMTILAH